MAPTPGDFGLTQIKGWTGWLIRFLQWLNRSGFRDYEHAFIVMPADKVLGAQPGGARLDDNTYDPAHTVYSAVALTTMQRQAIVSVATKLIGTPYSFLDYVSLALHRLHIRPKFVEAHVESTHHMICSQLVDAIYHWAGVQLFQDGRWPGDVTPGDLYDVLGGPK
jgi:uncharacterized protein YycO